MDIVRIAYTARVKDGGVIDTTDEQVAKDNNVYDDRHVYRPLTVVVGEKQVVAGLDEALASMEVGDSQSVEVPPEKGYGSRDPGLVRLVPMKAFKQQNINPVPGMPVELDGRPARVQTVAGGRVRVDFNHELAGKTLVYDITIEGKAESEEDKVRYLVERSFNSADGFDVKLSKKKLSLSLPEGAFRDRSILARKASLAADLFRFLGLEDVSYTESWRNPEKKEKDEGTGEKKEEKDEQAAEEK